MDKYRRLKISLTDSCNLNCAHCYLGTKAALYANLAVVLHRIEEARQLGVRILDLTGGEPTTHPQFCTILDVASGSGFERLNLSTNGLSLAKGNILPRLVSYQVHCNISLDGASAETVNGIRGKNVFRRLEQVFSILKERNVPFSLRFSINRLNAGEVREMLSYAEQWGVDADLEATQLIGNASKGVVLNSAEISEVQRTIREFKGGLFIHVEESFTGPYPCDGGFSDLLSLNTQGIGVTCLMITHENQRRNSDRRLSLQEMWEQIQGKKQEMRDFRPRFPECPSCQYYGLCATGCWVTAHSVGCFVPSRETGG